MSRAVAIAAAADEPGLRRAYAAGLARGATNTQCTAEEERTYGTLRLLTLATLRLPDLFLYAHIVEVLAGDRDPVPSVAVRAITTTAGGALRLAHRALETNARDVGYALDAWIDRALDYCPNPVHPDRNPSCSVRGPRPELWKCQACGAAGSIYDLASLVLGGPWGRGQLSDDAFRRPRAYVLDIFGELT